MPSMFNSYQGVDTKTATAQHEEVSCQHEVLSIEDAMERLGMGAFQFRILLAAGLCFAADAMEVLLLSFLSVVLKAEWELTTDQTASITSCVFVGAMCGTLCLGALGDIWGRKPVFSITAGIICVFGFATALANNFGSLVLCRFLVGFGVGGLTVPFDTLAEFVTASHRGQHLIYIEYFWTAGTLLVPSLAYFSLGGSSYASSWQWFVVLCAIPCLISTILGILVVPESPRWLLAKGRNEQALQVLRKAAIVNGKDPGQLFPQGLYLVAENKQEESSLRDLLSPEWRDLMLKVCGVWIGLPFLYYGTIIAVTLVFSEDDATMVDSVDPEVDYEFDFGAILASSSAEIVGTTLLVLTIDRFGRVCIQTVSYFLGGLCVLLLCWRAASLAGDGTPDSRTMLVVLAFLARMFMMSATSATWVSTAEILPTEIRTSGHSFVNAVSRVSGILVPFVVSSGTPLRVVGLAIFLFGNVTCFLCWSLPETQGVPMGAAFASAGDADPNDDDLCDLDGELKPSVEMIDDTSESTSHSDIATA